MGELKKMVDEGKIKYIGLSEASTDTIQRAHAVHPITAVQMEYSLWCREIEEDIIPLCRFNGENLEKNKELYVRIANISANHDCSPPQLALTWLLHQGDEIVPIPGTTKVKNLHNNLGSLGLKLDKEDLNEISEAILSDGVAGHRQKDTFRNYRYQLAITPMEVSSIMQMPRVKLGSQGLEVSRLGFGCGGLSGIYNEPLSHEAGCLIIKEAYSKGVTFFDTSDFYGDNHDNEIMIGKALKQLCRAKVQLSTKFGITRLGGDLFGVDGTPEYVRQSCEASLQRLDVDYIDLYFQHRVDVSVPIEDTMGELKKLVEEGKIKYIGLSEASTDTIERAHAVHPVSAVQMEYSLWSHEIEEDIIPLCRKLGIGIVAYSPLGQGFFGGKAVVESVSSNSILHQFPKFSGENLEKNKELYVRVSNIAVKHDCTPPQLALAWILHQGDDIVPIPGTTKVKNLQNNLGSLELKLVKQDLKEISEAIPVDDVAGHRQWDAFSNYRYQLAITPVRK